MAIPTYGQGYDAAMKECEKHIEELEADVEKWRTAWENVMAVIRNKGLKVEDFLRGK